MARKCDYTHAIKQIRFVEGPRFRQRSHHLPSVENRSDLSEARYPPGHNCLTAKRDEADQADLVENPHAIFDAEIDPVCR